MIKSINEKYCQENLVQLMTYPSPTQLIVNSEEIILLKIGDRVVINKYSNHPKRECFPFHEQERNMNGNFNELYKYQELYLNFRGYESHSDFQTYCFYPGTKKALMFNETLRTNSHKNLQAATLPREEIEKLFASSQYDSMYMFNSKGEIIFAKNPIDGNVLSREVLPSTEEINELVKPEPPKKMSARWLDLPTNIILTSTEGTLKLTRFKVAILKGNRYRLVTEEIPLIIPSVSEILEYANNNQIPETLEPEPPEVPVAEAIKHIDLSFINQSSKESDDDVKEINHSPTDKLTLFFSFLNLASLSSISIK